MSAMGTVPTSVFLMTGRSDMHKEWLLLGGLLSGVRVVRWIALFFAANYANNPFMFW